MSSSLRDSLQRLVDSGGVQEDIHWKACLNEPIVDVKIFDRGADIPEGFQVVSVYKEGRLREESPYESKLIAYKTAPFSQAQRILSAMTVQREDKIGGSSTLIGALHSEADSSFAQSYLVANWK